MTTSNRREYFDCAQHKYHDRNPVVLPLVGTLRGFLPGFTTRHTKNTRHSASPCIVLLPFLFGCVLILGLFGTHLAIPTPVFAQDEPAVDATGEETLPDEDDLAAPERVDVEPLAEDQEIAERLLTILQATEWFQAPTASVRDGVVFLDGRTTRDAYKEWAGALARNTQDVVAVVNRIQVIEPVNWDVTPAVNELRSLWRGFVASLPILLFAILILIVAWLAAKLAGWLARRALRNRVASPLLRNVLATVVFSVPIFLVGLYLVLQISGLTRLALTVIGGTGLAGLIVGIGFRDIMENFLASILISTRSPFHTGDRIQVAEYIGIVQQVTTRGTILMMLDGNHVQIPNSTVYKSNIVNFTANPLLRLDFNIGIGYEDSVPEAQAAIREVLRTHPALLSDPEPLVLVDSLGSSSVNLRIFFWINGHEHDALKVKSAIIRLVKRAMKEGQFTMPDEAREVIFPQGVPIRSVDGSVPSSAPEERYGLGDAQRPAHLPATAEPEPLSTESEGELSSEDDQLREQAREAPSPEGEENLLSNGG